MTNDDELFERLEEDFGEQNVYKILLQFSLPDMDNPEIPIRIDLPLLAPQGLTVEEVRIYAMGAQSSLVGVLRVLGLDVDPSPLREDLDELDG